MNNIFNQNNDDQEREERRKIVMHEPSIEYNNNSTCRENFCDIVNQKRNEEQRCKADSRDNETLKNCMKLFTEDKFNKDNVWSMSFIDSLYNLSLNNYRALDNLNTSGSFLEASGKIYGLRVDTVHADVLRLTQGHKKRKVIDIEAEPEIVEENQFNRRKKRRQIATVTRNLDRINGKFDTYPLADPIWGKLNSTVREVSSPNHFLQNILFSEGGSLRMTSNYKYWSKEDWEEHSKPHSLHEILSNDLISVPMLEKIRLNNCVLRSIHAIGKYKITDIPASLDELLQNDGVDICEYDMPEHFFNHPSADDSIPLVFDDMEDRYGTLEEKESTVIMEDLRPTNSNILEYSYRPMESVKKYWAGPSYWKFLDSMRSGQINSTGNRTIFVGMSSERARNKQKLDFTQIPKDVFFNISSNKLKQTSLTPKNWNAINFIEPTNYEYHHTFFDTYTLAPNWNGIEFRRFHEENEVLETEIVIVFSEDEDESEGNDMDESMIPSTQDIISDDISLTKISDNFIGAPEKVLKIVVPFAERAKIIDMKLLKRCSLLSITNQLLLESGERTSLKRYRDESYLPGTATFSGTYHNLLRGLPRTNAEELTPSLAFYSVLYLCNEHNLRIFPQEDLKDFKIRKLE